MIFLSVLLNILKIIGIVILSVLALIIVLVLLILLSPVRYKGRIKYENEPDIEVRFSYLLHIVNGFFFLKGKEKKFDARIFTFSLLHRKKKEKKPRKKKTSTSAGKKTGRKDLEKHEKKSAISEKKAVTERPKETSSSVKAESDSKENQQEEKNSKKSIFKKLSDRYNGIKQKISAAIDKVKGILEKKDAILKEIQDENNREAVMFALKMLKKVLKHILPRKYKIYVRFGMGDPAKTGEVLGLVYAFGAWLGLNIVAEPDFDNKVFECDVPFKGRISIIVLAIWALKTYRNKNIKALYKKIRGND